MRRLFILLVLTLIPACKSQSSTNAPQPATALPTFATPISSSPQQNDLTPQATLLLENQPFQAPTPTQLPKPHVIKVIDWEMVTVTSKRVCDACGIVETSLAAPEGLNIAGVQVYAVGEPGSASRLAANLIYSEEIECAPVGSEGYCGFISGQVYEGEVTFSAQFVRGGWQQIRYIVTFQSWEAYEPPAPSVTQYPYPAPTNLPYPPP